MNQRRAEFDRFVAGITGTLLRTAYLIVWDLGEAEDLVQETLLEVARRWPRVRRMERPAAYARRILINRALSGAGRRARRRRELAAEPPPDRVTVTDDGAVIDGHDELMAALAALPPRQRAVLVLRYFLDLPEAEVAAALKCSPRHRQEHRRSWTRATRAGARHDQRDKEHPDMNDQLESDLRAALRARAAGVPATAVIRLTGLDYRPRTWGLRPPVAVGALTSPAAAGGLVAIVSLGAGASNAFAGWTPKPTAPAPGQIAAARASCEASQSPLAGLPLKLADTRGPFTFAVYADDRSSATCIKGPSFTAVSASVASSAVSVPAGQVLLSSEHRSDRAGQAFSFAEGRTGAGVSGVTLTLDDGSNVQATVGGGWFVAWWPGGHEIKSARLTTPTGAKPQTFNLSPEIPCTANQACDSGGSSVSGERGAGAQVKGFSLSR